MDRYVVCSVKFYEFGDGRRGDFFDFRDYGVDLLGGLVEEVDGFWVCIGESDCGCGIYVVFIGICDDILKYCKKCEMIVSYGMVYKFFFCYCFLSVLVYFGRWWFC